MAEDGASLLRYAQHYRNATGILRTAIQQAAIRLSQRMEEITSPEAARPTEISDLQARLKRAEAALYRISLEPLQSDATHATIQLNSPLEQILQKFKTIRIQLDDTPVPVTERGDNKLRVEIPADLRQPGKTYQLRVFLDEIELPSIVSLAYPK